MKANELRIGDYVTENTYGVKRIGKIIAIKEKQVVLRLENSIIATSIKNIEPIPLTEEWLLKFGFIQDTGEPERFFNDIISLTKYKNSWTIEYNNNDFVFEYVHDLQNLYFALKGEELKL